MTTNLHASPQAARFTDRIAGTVPTDTIHRRNNYEICEAIDLTSLAVILEKMIDESGLHPQVATNFFAQASALRSSILTENNRIHNY